MVHNKIRQVAFQNLFRFLEGFGVASCDALQSLKKKISKVKEQDKQGSLTFGFSLYYPARAARLHPSSYSLGHSQKLGHV